MSIISLSLDDRTNRKIEDIMEKSAFDNRSELIRKSIADLHVKTTNQNIPESGEALMIVKHPHSSEHKVSELLHDKDDIIQTQLHSKLDSQDCVEILLLKGKGTQINQLEKQLTGSKFTERVETIAF